MRYILILLMIGGVAKGQPEENKSYRPVYYNSRHVSSDTTIEIKYGYMPSKGQSTIDLIGSTDAKTIYPEKARFFVTGILPINIIDTCQRYRDSVDKYDYNIKMWKRKQGPNMTQLERIAVEAILRDLQNHRDEFFDKAKKCKP